MTESSGPVVAITGASSGIGAATAVELAGRGARLVLGARRADRLAEVVAQVEAVGGAAVAVTVDVRDREGPARLVRTAQQQFGRLDVLVSNAGSMAVSPLDELRVDEWEQMVDVNLKGVLWGIAAALPVFRDHGSGHFVHTVSTAAYKVVPEQAVYAATKTAVRALTEGLRQEAGPTIRVTMVSPGFTHTDGIGVGGNPDSARAMVAKRDEIAMPPDAVARAIAFALEQPADIDVNEIVVRPTVQV